MTPRCFEDSRELVGKAGAPICMLRLQFHSSKMNGFVICMRTADVSIGLVGNRTKVSLTDRRLFCCLRISLATFRVVEVAINLLHVYFAAAFFLRWKYFTLMRNFLVGAVFTPFEEIFFWEEIFRTSRSFAIFLKVPFQSLSCGMWITSQRSPKDNLIEPIPLANSY